MGCFKMEFSNGRMEVFCLPRPIAAHKSKKKKKVVYFKYSFVWETKIQFVDNGPNLDLPQQILASSPLLCSKEGQSQRGSQD